MKDSFAEGEKYLIIIQDAQVFLTFGHSRKQAEARTRF
jgi:hypothetical protein